MDFKQVFLMPGGIAGSTRLCAHIVLGKNTACRQDKREAFIGALVCGNIFGVSSLPRGNAYSFCPKRLRSLYSASKASRGLMLSGSRSLMASRRVCSSSWSSLAWSLAGAVSANKSSCAVWLAWFSSRSSSRLACRITATGMPARWATWIP